VDGKLLEFIKDLHSGKLHKDFHNPPPPTQQTSTTTIVSVAVSLLFNTIINFICLEFSNSI
ncbi:unnamed protein product, partial [Rotaria sp. Silwood1]